MKIFKVLSIMIVSILILSNVMAYSNDSYSIDVPTTYTVQNQSESDDYIMFVKDDATNINIYMRENTDETNIKDATESDMEEFVSSYINQIKSSYDINLDVLKKEKTTINGYDALFISTKWNSEDMYGYDIYQNQYILTSKNHIYTLTLTSNNSDEFNSQDVLNIKSSFTIKDELIKDDSGLLTGVFVGILIIVIASVIIFRKLKKAKNSQNI